jgi:hypothetical protein
MIPFKSNRPELCGVHYDWVTGSPTYGAAVSTRYYTPFVMNGSMPVNQRNRFRNGHPVTGGDWVMYKYEQTRGATSKMAVYRQSGGLAYDGMFYLDAHPAGSFLTPPSGWSTTSLVWSALSSRGAEAWNRMRPDQPDFSAFQEVGEMREALTGKREAVKSLRDRVKAVAQSPGSKGKLPDKRTTLDRVRGTPLAPSSVKELRALTKRGSQFNLAVTFGWFPLMRSIQSAIEAHKGFDKRLSQLIKDNERPVRRTTKLKDAENQTSAVQQWSQQYTNGYGALLVPSLVTQCYGGKAHREVISRVESRTWAVGQFRYILPPGPRNAAWSRKMYGRIMGARITPAGLYELMPWSWFIDYFVDLGQFMKAISPGVADNLICDYAYLMKETTWDALTTATVGVLDSRNSVQYGTATYHTRYTRKMRVRATPFGFGITEGSLSPKQKAISGSLGISKLL